MRRAEEPRTDAEAIAYIERYTAPVYDEGTGKIVGYDLEEAEYQFLLCMAKQAVQFGQAVRGIVN